MARTTGLLSDVLTHRMAVSANLFMFPSPSCFLGRNKLFIFKLVKMDHCINVFFSFFFLSLCEALWMDTRTGIAFLLTVRNFNGLTAFHKTATVSPASRRQVS